METKNQLSWPKDFDNYLSIKKWLQEELMHEQFSLYKNFITDKQFEIVSKFIGFNCEKMSIGKICAQLGTTDFKVKSILKKTVKEIYLKSKKNILVSPTSLIDKQQLEAAFKAGWMRANATNYDPSYFEHFLSETYGNNNH